MSSSADRLIQAAAGIGGEAVYVDDVFSTYLSTDSGFGPHTIVNGIDLSGEGGMVWWKRRDSAGNWQCYDTERGATKHLSLDQTSAEATVSLGLTAFNSDGFTFDTSMAKGDDCTWTFRKQPGFFDVVTYTGNSTNGHVINHNLGSTPGFIVIKNRTTAGYAWTIYHRSIPTQYLEFNTNAAQNTALIQQVNDTSFVVQNNAAINGNNQSYVAYLFAHDAQDFGTDSDESIIKCGSYTGNGSTDGPEVDLGFEAQWVLIKNIGAVGWIMADNMRGMSNGGYDPYLRPNDNTAEYTTYDWIHPTATGFKLTQTGSSLNTNGQTYVYVAIRRPHKPASEFAATDLFGIDLTSAGTPAYDPGFTTDFIYQRAYAQTQNNFFLSRLTGNKYLLTESTNTEATGNSINWDYQTGAVDNFGSTTYAGWCFRRAPGFFDVVAYTGTGTAGLSINHNLGVTPEMMIVKRRNSSQGWAVYHYDANASPATGACQLESNSAFIVSSVYWNDTAPTDTVFTLGSSNITNNNNDTYIAYLFATVPGISKVGGYTGTGSDVDVDCGFTSGARFVLVKRTDSTGDWYVWDSVRGIVAGNDPYLLLNSTAAQVTSTDYIDPLSSGFTITSSAPAALNASGGNYIFLAIA